MEWGPGKIVVREAGGVEATQIWIHRSRDQEMDAEDILGDSLSTLYSYTPITHSSAGSLFTYSSPTHPLQIHLKTPDTNAGNWALHASSIWVSSLYLADHVDLLGLTGGEKILELGAGAGCPGIVIAKLHQDVRVTLSDYPDEQLIQCLRENAEENASFNTKVVSHAWGSKEVEGLGGEFDLIIAADTLWNVDMHTLFLDSLELLLAKNATGRVVLVAGLHTGRWTVQKFFKQVQERNVFRIEEVAERRVQEGDWETQREWAVERELEDEKDRRDWVVWVVLKWRSCSSSR